jgi:hypothetical protein
MMEGTAGAIPLLTTKNALNTRASNLLTPYTAVLRIEKQQQTGEFPSFQTEDSPV